MEAREEVQRKVDLLDAIAMELYRVAKSARESGEEKRAEHIETVFLPFLHNEREELLQIWESEGVEG